MSELHRLNPSLHTEGPERFDFIILKVLQHNFNLLHELYSSNVKGNGYLLGVYVNIFEVLLNHSEQLLDWVEPWTILSIEEHIHFHLPTCLEYRWMSMDDSIVHQQHNWPLLVIWINSNWPQCLIDEIFKDRRVHTSFNDLRGDHSLLWHGCYQWDWVLLLLSFHLAHS